nr:hypothetical protein [uncultured Caproiciproducens sp.]
MRNKMILTVCGLVIVIVLAACSVTKTTASSSLERIPEATDNVKVAVVKGDAAHSPKSLGEVEKLSPYIVKGRLRDDAKQKLDAPIQGMITYGITVSTLEISQVYKGNFKVGDTIPLAEKYYTLEENGESTRYEMGYAPSVPGQEYVFFLVKAPDESEILRGTYSPMVKETGRYPVINTKDSGVFDIRSMSPEDLNLVNTELSTYQKIYQEVINKYMK